MSARIYIEGGGTSNALHIQCRRAFRTLFEGCGFSGRMPRLWACGSRDDTYGDFRTAHETSAPDEYVAMLVDSEDPGKNVGKTWDHLNQRDGWKNLKVRGMIRFFSWLPAWRHGSRQTGSLSRVITVVAFRNQPSRLHKIWNSAIDTRSKMPWPMPPEAARMHTKRASAPLKYWRRYPRIGLALLRSPASTE